ncbi:MAG: calcium:proton antiporter [Pseudomonadota bacterium]
MNTLKRFLREDRATLGGIAVLLLLIALEKYIGPESVGLMGVMMILLGLFSVMLWCAFNVVHHAEALATRLGEPYGTLILTLAVIVIEVALISAVMLTGADSPTIARDTMMAVIMIAMNLLVGISLVVGGIRHRTQVYNLEGANAFLTVLIPLAVFGLIMPSFTSSAPGGEVSALQAVYLSLVSVVLYGIFLIIQTVTHSDIFQQPAGEGELDHDTAEGTDSDDSTLYHAVTLIVALLPIILLAKLFANYMDRVIAGSGLPVALGGIMVAILILTPEGLSAIRAAQRNALQRAVNLCLGSALASIGMTLPAVIAISLLTGYPLVLGLGIVEAIMLALTLLVGVVTFVSERTNVMQGAVHLALFFGYLIMVFDGA